METFESSRARLKEAYEERKRLLKLFFVDLKQWLETSVNGFKTIRQPTEKDVEVNNSIEKDLRVWKYYFRYIDNPDWSTNSLLVEVLNKYIGLLRTSGRAQRALNLNVRAWNKNEREIERLEAIRNQEILGLDDLPGLTAQTALKL
tara:strand:+ start:522 stop:959 length:438 start_codon:yes stop_codon:yes gene_type:complete